MLSCLLTKHNVHQRQSDTGTDGGEDARGVGQKVPFCSILKDSLETVSWQSLFFFPFLVVNIPCSPETMQFFRGEPLSRGRHGECLTLAFLCLATKSCQTFQFLLRPWLTTISGEDIGV